MLFCYRLRFLPRIVPGLVLLCVLPSCALWDPLLDIDEFAAYAEQVFKQQNAITDQIIDAAELLNKEQYARLSQAELKMHDACQLLNEYAVRERDGLERGIFFQQQVQRSISGCDQSLKSVAKLLHELQVAD